MSHHVRSVARGPTDARDATSRHNAGMHADRGLPGADLAGTSDDPLECVDLRPGVRFARRESAVTLTFDRPWQALSSAVLGGGRGPLRSVLNLHVPASYAGTNPEADLRRATRLLRLPEPVVGLMTAVRLNETQRVEATVAGRRVWSIVTVGVGNATRAGTATRAWASSGARPGPGTINAIILLEAHLRDAAAMELAMIVTEAKAAAMVESGLRTAVGDRVSGTSTDAVAIVWPSTASPHVRHAGAATELGDIVAATMSAAIRSSVAMRMVQGSGADGDPDG